jgi:hypothetical protein
MRLLVNLRGLSAKIKPLWTRSLSPFLFFYKSHDSHVLHSESFPLIIALIDRHNFTPRGSATWIADQVEGLQFRPKI